MHPSGTGGLTFNAIELDELYARVAPAHDLSLAGSGYVHDAVAEIVRWFEDRRLARFERTREAQALERRRRNGELIRLLKETDPDRIGRVRALGAAA